MFPKKDPNKKNYILNPCDDCPQRNKKDDCLLEEFVSCQAKMALENCLSQEYGEKYFAEAIVRSIEEYPDRNKIIKEVFLELSKYIK